ncbi:hypothetical protein BDY19DRAFT_982573 [Irpex rosettiformis]|uniref:Uncharacterized protein n=1 Tax=Irpex rosettiformis TaxID=378272 RepID=A0ACB8UH22_9APHY|nr:hypothetical protein BDY19DRAFT_982573 [Irpex rosettiformis]
MSWFSSLFTGSKNTRTSGRTAMSSTLDAFSLPPSSPGYPVDGFQSGSPLSPTMTIPSGSYSYPPQSPTGSYDYVPTGQSSLLPLHQSGPMKTPFPPLSATWNRLRAWLSNEYPELGDTLNYGILPQDLAQIEMAFGFALPQAVRDSYLCANGQEPESSAVCSEGLFFGLTLLPLEDVLEEWRFWREVDDDPNTGANPRLRDLMDSIPPGWVRKEYSSRGWIPLIADKAGNYLGVDLSPGESGVIGQVIVFGRDFDTKVVMYRGDGEHGWAKWLSGFVDDLESGEGYELGTNAEGSEGSEDSVGYESYFFDGTGRGSGDGGGDGGPAGMRLAGEYKGWNVLEAWADRSLRKWQELGIISETEESPSVPVKNQSTNPVSLEAIKALANTSGAEVPIPVVAGSSREPSTLNHVPLLDEPSATPEVLPIISVTKPPAPVPISLPTADDLVAISDSTSSDLEAGGDLGMREVASALPAVSKSPVSPTPTQMQSPHAEKLPSPLPPPPISPNHTPTRTFFTGETVDSPTSATTTTDLLVETSNSLASIAVEPLVATPPDEPLSQSQSPPSPTTSAESPVLVHSEDALPPTTDSIRPVSTDGLAGLGSEPISSEGVLVSEPEDSVEPLPASKSMSPEPQERGRHEKKKSISAGLKKLGHIGGKRRTDSVSSQKSQKSVKQ